MLSMLDHQAVERQLGRIAGVQRVTASIASNSATVEYDETVTGVAALEAKINACGFHCTGQVMPKHVCEPHAGTTAGRRAPTKPADSKAIASEARPTPEPRAQAPAGAPVAATAAMPMSHDISHDMALEMGHGAGMDMQAMMRDM